MLLTVTDQNSASADSWACADAAVMKSMIDTNPNAKENRL